MLCHLYSATSQKSHRANCRILEGPLQLETMEQLESDRGILTRYAHLPQLRAYRLVSHHRHRMSCPPLRNLWPLLLVLLHSAYLSQLMRQLVLRTCK